jgi:hypothetical protein
MQASVESSYRLGFAEASAATERRTISLGPDLDPRECRGAADTYQGVTGMRPEERYLMLDTNMKGTRRLERRRPRALPYLSSTPPQRV